MVVEALLDGQAEALADKALEMALGGDTRTLHALLADRAAAQVPARNVRSSQDRDCFR